MKKCLAIAALLLAGTVTAAQAQYTFEYGGRTITIDPDRGTVSIPGVYDNTGKKTKRARGEEGDLDRPTRKAPQQAKTSPQAAPETAPAPAVSAPAEQAAAPATAPAPAAPAPAAPATATAAPSSSTAAVAPADAAAPAAAAPAAPPVQQNAAPVVPPAPAPVAAPAPPPPQQKQAAAPAASEAPANSPLGVWLTEEKEGKVRIEPCGPNLCGYSVDKKSNQNGEQVLINMKPGKDKWSGRIFDPNTGSTYDSTIALKGTDSLRVQGCAFGGMFCGGQTWTRVN